VAPPTPESAGYSRLTEEGPLAPASTPVGSVAARCVSLAVLGVGRVAVLLSPEVAHTVDMLGIAQLLVAASLLKVSAWRVACCHLVFSPAATLTQSACPVLV
jgi:hypothetical protein